MQVKQSLDGGRKREILVDHALTKRTRVEVFQYGERITELVDRIPLSVDNPWIRFRIRCHSTTVIMYKYGLLLNDDYRVADTQIDQILFDAL